MGLNPFRNSGLLRNMPLGPLGRGLKTAFSCPCDTGIWQGTTGGAGDLDVGGHF